MNLFFLCSKNINENQNCRLSCYCTSFVACHPPSLPTSPFPVLIYTVSCPLKAKNPKKVIQNKKIFEQLLSTDGVNEPSFLQHYPAMGSAALYFALITTAWLKIPWIIGGDGGTWQKTKTPVAQKWQRHHQKQHRTWRGASKGTKTYLPGQREHHHPLGLYPNPTHNPPCGIHSHTQIPLLLDTLEHTHTLEYTPSFLWPIVLWSSQTAGCRSHQYLICFRALPACNRG